MAKTARTNKRNTKQVEAEAVTVCLPIGIRPCGTGGRSASALLTRELPNKPGIYLMIHRKTRDSYVGQSLSIRDRIRMHMSCLIRLDPEENSGLVALVRKHGINFRILVLAVTERTYESLDAAEKFWIGIKRPTLNHGRMSQHGLRPRVARRRRNCRYSEIPILPEDRSSAR